jgi:2-oxoglutarate/2-oxoacid ferredoxin oxidoreductase subunit beta
VPLIKTAIEHQGAAFIDCISPCVAFNNHVGSTKSFDYVRAHNAALNALDFISPQAPITAEYEAGSSKVIDLHDGSSVRLRKIARDHDINDRHAAMAVLHRHKAAGEIVTGLLYLDPEPEDLHNHLGSVDTPLNALNEAELCPGSALLDKLNAALR